MSRAKKMRTHKGVAARVRVTRNGKVVRKQCGVRHLMTHRTAKVKRQRRNSVVVPNKGEAAKLRRALNLGQP